MFAISGDEEAFHGSYSTIEEAIGEAANGYAYKVFWVGECEAPTQPEAFWYAEDWLEHVSCQDDYSGEWAEDWDDSTRAQRAELEENVRKVMAEWLDKHNLRPRHFKITNSVRYRVLDGVAEASVE